MGDRSAPIKIWSLLSWERGLKFFKVATMDEPTEVAPLVGAWIEMDWKSGKSMPKTVAPLVGAWIEIRENEPCCNGKGLSLLSWERGLK